jgi:hypothetical protein
MVSATEGCARDWLKKKYKLTDETIDNECLGYSFGDISPYLKRKGFTQEEIIDAGFALIDLNKGHHNPFING